MSMLPTKLQALKLHFFLKDEAGRKNWTVTPGEITCKVAKVIKHTGVQDCLLIPRIKLPSFWRTIRISTSIKIPKGLVSRAYTEWKDWNSISWGGRSSRFQLQHFASQWERGWWRQHQWSPRLRRSGGSNWGPRSLLTEHHDSED